MAAKERSRNLHSGADESTVAFHAFSRRLQRARGDAQQILELVRDAERAVTDQRQLSEIYNVAMRTFGPCPHQACPEAYGELSVKRLEVLCALDPEEARMFHRFMMHYSIRKQDANVHLARARMEVRHGNLERAASLLEEGLRANAQPAEPMHKLLSELGRTARQGGAAVPTQAPAGVLPAPTGSETPLRPRELRYSGCTRTCEDLSALGAVAEAQLAAAAAAGGADGTAPSSGGRVSPLTAVGSAASFCGFSGLGAVPPLPGGPASTASTASGSPADMGAAAACGLGSTARLSVAPPRPSMLDSLSPILEAESMVEDPSLTADCLDQQRRAPAAQAAFGQRRTSVPSPGQAALPVQGGHQAPAADVELAEEPSGTISEMSEGGVGRPQKTFTVNGVPYVRVQTIGRGGSSKVHEVRGPAGEIRALKRVTSTCPSTFEAYANEVTLLQSLKEHRSVIHVYDAEVDAERSSIQIVMERGGLDLGRLLQQADEHLSLGDMQTLWRQMLEAVQAVHSERIVHSDLKPANFLFAGGRLKLIDFGIAKRISSETTHINRDATVGTISYMAPEAVRHGAVKLGRPSDIWSLGIILYQMAYRRSPFAHLEPMQRLFALSDPEVDVEFPEGHRLENHSPEIQALLIDVLGRCLQRDPAKRASIPELLEHPFLQDRMRLTRAPFDRAMEAIVSGFYAAAREVLGDPEGEEGVDDAQEDRWQWLSDEVWERLSQPQEGEGAVAPHRPLEGSASFQGFAAFRECLQRWVARGDAKRQRTGVAVSEAPSSSSAAPARPPGARRPAAPPPGPPPPRALPAATRPPPPPPPQRTAAVRAPLRAVNTTGPQKAPQGSDGGPGGGGGYSSIAEELILKQRSILRKASGGKENADENRGQTGAGGAKAGEPVESLVLRRLRDRRALVEDQRVEEEHTEVTGWAH